jgi:hypothetical protein
MPENEEKDEAARREARARIIDRQEARWKMANRKGRRLRPDEIVHHLDGDPTNNDPANLVVMALDELKRSKEEQP